MKKRVISFLLCIVMCMGMVSIFSGCGAKTDAFVIMTEQLDGLFNPFFYTSAPDGTIVAMTRRSLSRTTRSWKTRTTPPPTPSS